MNKTKVTLDSFYKLHPNDASAINIVGKKTLTISDFINNDVDIVAMIINKDIAKTSGFEINGNGIIQLPVNSTALSFSVGNEPKNKATFNFEVL